MSDAGFPPPAPAGCQNVRNRLRAGDDLKFSKETYPASVIALETKDWGGKDSRKSGVALLALRSLAGAATKSAFRNKFRAESFFRAVHLDRSMNGFRWKWEKSGAGGGDRTRIASLEGWNSTIELHPQIPRILINDACVVNFGPYILWLA